MIEVAFGSRPFGAGTRSNEWQGERAYACISDESRTKTTRALIATSPDFPELTILGEDRGEIMDSSR